MLELGLRRQSVLYRFPDLMLGTPVLTAHKAKDSLGISFQAASAALAQLEEMGLLVQKVQTTRNGSSSLPGANRLKWRRKTKDT